MDLAYISVFEKLIFMKIIKIRTIQEAKQLELPPFPRALLDEAHQFQLKTMQSNMSRHSILRQIYALVDKGSQVVDKLTVCKKGCAACCEISVGLSELEASYIERNTGRRMALGVRSSVSHKTDSRCPFLSSENSCSIYEFRPLACRVYAAFDDPDLCAQLDVAHMTYSADSNSLFAGSRQWIVGLNAAGAIADIRDFFGKGEQQRLVR